MRRNRRVLVDVGDVIAVLVPDPPRPRPLVRDVLEHDDARVSCALEEQVGADDDVGVPVVVDVGDDRLFGPCARSDESLRELHAVRTAEDAKILLVAVDDLDLAVAIEVERNRAGGVRTAIDDGDAASGRCRRD